MSGAKERILALLGNTDLNELGIERLVDVLGDKLKAQVEEIKQLENKNESERQHLREQYEALYRDRRELHSNPVYGAAGNYFFVDDSGNRFCVRIQGHVDLVKRIRMKKSDMWVSSICRQISPTEFEAA